MKSSIINLYKPNLIKKNKQINKNKESQLIHNFTNILYIEREEEEEKG